MHFFFPAVIADFPWLCFRHSSPSSLFLAHYSFLHIEVPFIVKVPHISVVLKTNQYHNGNIFLIFQKTYTVKG